MASSARGLKEELTKIAKKRAVSTSKIVEQIFVYAVGNPGSFPTQIDKPRPKPGKLISTTIPAQVADTLTMWAKQLGRSRAAHCCFILECVVDDLNLQQKIFN
jgi:hypothetical protein